MRSAIQLKRPSVLHWLVCLILGLALVGLSACASGPRLSDHAFEYSVSSDSPGVELLDYRYGEYAMTRVPEWQKREGRVAQGGGVNGAFPRGDFLYVKWRVKSTGEVYEDTVDLKSRLPEDIARQTVYFLTDGPQLYVYLISRDPIRGYLTPEEARVADQEATTPHKKALRKYIRHKIITVYPDQPKRLESKKGD